MTRGGAMGGDAGDTSPLVGKTGEDQQSAISNQCIFSCKLIIFIKLRFGR